MANYNIDAIYNGNTSLPGTERVRIDSSGNIGIGTTGPSAKLHVVGNTGLYQTAGSTYLYYDHSGVNTWRTGIFATNTSTYIIGHDTGGVFATKIFAITVGGSVGIGTTGPLQVLHVNGNILLDGVTNGYEQSATRGIGYGSSSGGVSVNGFSGMDIQSVVAGGNYSQNVRFWAHHYGQASGATPRMFIQYNGNVGIGSVAPTQKLDVAGNINSDNSRTVTYTSVTSGPAGSWYPLFAVNDGTDASVLCNLKSFAHSSVSFIAAKGYGPSQTHAVSILNCQQNANSGYANVVGVRIRQSGWVEIQLSWSSGPTVDIGVQIVGSNYVPTFAANLSPTAAVDAIVDTVSLANGMMRSRGNFEAAGGYIAANTTSPARPLTVNGDGTNPCIRLINSAFATSANTALYTFRGWLPIDIGTTKYYLQVFN